MLTVDGNESTFQTNYLAPFLLQSLLHDLVAGTPGARVVVTSSIASHVGRVELDDLQRSRERYRAFSAYASTKLLDILFVSELRRRLAPAGATATAVHPGAVGSHFGAGSLLPPLLYRVPIRKRYIVGLFVKTVEQGAEPLVWLATHPDRGAVDSLYFSRFRKASPPEQALDRRLAREVWERSTAMVEGWLG